MSRLSNASYAYYSAAGLSCGLYALLAFFVPRENFWLLVSVFAALFGLYFYLYKKTAVVKPRAAFGFGLGFRLIFLFALPSLSDDYFRFAWDGALFSQGISPFLYLPAETAQALPSLETPYMAGLLSEMNSPRYYSVYPPICQWVFASGAWLFPERLFAQVVWMKALIVLAEIGTYFFLRRSLALMGKPEKNALLYFLNPLAIVEIAGNLHFEGFMICFLAASFYGAMRQKRHLSALLFAAAVCVKLIPLLFLPFFIRKEGFKKSLVFYGITALCGLFLFLPFYSPELLANMGKSVGLYFQTFEFNASLYYIVRWAGFWAKGYNIIATAGKVLSFCVLAIVCWMAFRKEIGGWPRFFSLCATALGVYLAFATTLHPWYSLPLLFVGVLGGWRFPVVATAASVLSYHAYSGFAFSEDPVLLWMEYAAVYGAVLWEKRQYYSIRFSV